jgi:subtilisin family serine protease
MEVLQFLQAPENQSQITDLRTLWTINAIALRASPAVINALAQRTGIAAIDIDQRQQWIKPTPQFSASRLNLNLNPTAYTPLPISSSQSPTQTVLSRTLNRSLAQAAPAPTPENVAWGVGRIRADQVWKGLGITGQGVVVANIDTGVDWQHPTLRQSYRGLGNGVVPDHLHNWFDATSEAASYPSDQHSHGTHTMGTIVGENGTGVAPGAQWMACKAFDSSGYALDSWLYACFQFMLAPGGVPTLAPDIINNSWGDSNGKLTDLQRTTEILRAAGILALFSSGNDGPEAGTVGSPASNPGVASVGATDQDEEVAWFSSRGPSPINNETKPLIVAPGVLVPSSIVGGSYALYNGTSMAAPHVSGAAALLLNANPTLDIRAMLYALTSTAVQVGRAITIPNNDSGFGRIDAYAAVLSVLDTGVITGSVRESGASGAPIPFGTVTAVGNTPSGTRRTTTTADVNGNYSMRVPFGMYTATASAFGFSSASLGPRLVVTRNVVAFNFGLIERAAGVVRGRVRNVVTGAVVTATVSALGTPKQSLSNSSCPPCRYSLDLPAGTYTLEVRALGYVVQTRTVSLLANSIIDADFDLIPTQKILLVDAGAWYYLSEAKYYRDALNALRLSYDEYRILQVPRDTPVVTDLLRYDTVIWSAPYDSPGLIGAGDAISGFLGAGRNMLLSGQDVATFDGGGFAFIYQYFAEKMNAYYRGTVLGVREVYGAPDAFLDNKTITLENGGEVSLGESANNQITPDAVAVWNNDKGGLFATYNRSDLRLPRGAGVFASLCFPHRSAFYAFGLEGIDSLADRAEVISRTLSAFDAPRLKDGVELVSRDVYLTGDAIATPGSVVTHTVRVRNTGEAGSTDVYSISLAGNAWPATLSKTSVSLKPCATELITITVTIPATATMNLRDTVTVRATSTRNPSATDEETFGTKTPATILLVDDERFTQSEAQFLDALKVGGNTAVDHWDGGRSQSVGLATAPPFTLLRHYPLVIWFNGYDWYDPITSPEQEHLRQYLDGGGRLFFTSQAALHYTNGNEFDQNYFGIAAIDYADPISSIVGTPETPVGNGFVATSLEPFPYHLSLSTAVQPMRHAQVLLRSNSGQPAALGQKQLNKDKHWGTVFMPFAFEVLSQTARNDLMNRVVGWLSWLGDSALVADKTSVVSGDRVRYTLTLRADSFAAPGRSPTQTVSVAVPLVSALNVVSSTLPNASIHHAGAWTGTMRAGDVLTWTFEAQVGTAPQQMPLTATIQIGLEDIGVRWKRDTVVRVDAPKLSAALAFETPLLWGGRTTATVRVRNEGPTAAPRVSVTVPLPMGLQIDTSNPGFVRGAGNAVAPALSLASTHITWTGTLLAGEEFWVSYPISIPQFAANLGMPPVYAFYNSVRAETANGVVAQATRWLEPETRRMWFPVIMRRAKATQQ